MFFDIWLLNSDLAHNSSLQLHRAVLTWMFKMSSRLPTPAFPFSSDICSVSFSHSLSTHKAMIAKNVNLLCICITWRWSCRSGNSHSHPALEPPEIWLRKTLQLKVVEGGTPFKFVWPRGWLAGVTNVAWPPSAKGVLLRGTFFTLLSLGYVSFLSSFSKWGKTLW